MHYTSINGNLFPSTEAQSLIQDLTANAGIGLVETMLFKDGTIELKNYHFHRLNLGLVTLHSHQVDLSLLERHIVDLAEKNGLSSLCRMRLQVQPLAAPSSLAHIIECIPVTAEVPSFNTTGLIAGVLDSPLKQIDQLANFKTTNLSVYKAGQSLAQENHWDDTLIRNDQGRIIESTIGNLFWVKDSILYTPPLSEGCIAGVMRKFILEELPNFGYQVHQTPLSESSLYKADEVFLTNAIRRIKWVSQVGPNTYANNLSRKIHSLLFA